MDYEHDYTYREALAMKARQVMHDCKVRRITRPQASEGHRYREWKAFSYRLAQEVRMLWELGYGKIEGFEDMD